MRSGNGRGGGGKAKKQRKGGEERGKCDETKNMAKVRESEES